MAENADGQEKSEEPTEKKKQKALEEGQVTRSKELATLMTLLASIIGLYFFSKQFLEAISNIFRENYIKTKEEIFDASSLILQFRDTLSDTIWAIFPFLLTMAVIAIIANSILGGFNFTWKPLIPKFSKFNIIKGVKKMFGKQGMVELLKSIVKITLLGFIAVMAMWAFRYDLFVLFDYDFIDAFQKVMEMLALQFLIVTLGMIVVALIDVPYQIYKNKTQLKMTKQEVKDESKNAEGNPEVKGRIRQIQRQLAIQRMMGSVPDADVVITNPTHYAVALKYDEEKGGAPIVVAKGVDFIALQIVKIAKGNEVMVLEIPPLSRSIYYHTEIDQEIPAGLYVAVAQVLAFIFQIKNGDISKFSRFDPSGMDIPQDLQR